LVDLLSQALAATHLQSSMLGIIELRAPWAIDFEQASGAPTHYVEEGEMWFSCPPDPPVRLMTGDLVMIPRWDRYILASSVDQEPVRIRQAIASAQGPAWIPGELMDAPIRLAFGGQGSRCKLLSMAFRVRDPDHNPLILGLPRTVLIRSADRIMSGLLEPALRFIGEEAALARPGYAVASNRLAELLFIQIIRCQLLVAPGVMTGMLRGLADPALARALAAMHARPDKSWTIASLAVAAGMSRSVFAARFRDLVGSTVLDYLTNLRVALAAERLAGGASAKAAAAAAGYTSATALREAFHRTGRIRPAPVRVRTAR
jgi:AraC-like DNA-binding protein